MNLQRWIDKDVKQGLLAGTAVGAALLAALWLWLPNSGSGSPPMAGAQLTAPTDPTQFQTRQLDLGGEPIGADARRVAHWVLASGDHGARPFVILDKRGAQLLVFAPEGRLLGASPVLLGYARGDDTVPGIGERPIESIRPEERTTPAGRFAAQLGRNALGEDVVWVDYEAAVSMHRVRLTDPKE